VAEIDYQKAFDTYFQVVEEARKVRAYYLGLTDGQSRVCSDPVGELIKALNGAERRLKIIRTIVSDDSQTVSNKSEDDSQEKGLQS
jgi:hypothetical protein